MKLNDMLNDIPNDTNDIPNDVDDFSYNNVESLRQILPSQCDIRQMNNRIYVLQRSQKNNNVNIFYVFNGNEAEFKYLKNNLYSMERYDINLVKNKTEELLGSSIATGFLAGKEIKFLDKTDIISFDFFTGDIKIASYTKSQEEFENLKKILNSQSTDLDYEILPKPKQLSLRK